MSVNKDTLPVGYKKMWPLTEGGLMENESYALVIQSMRNQETDKWGEAIELYTKMNRTA
jgi:hypothetical protein